jgi:hypothetical protein
METPINTVTNLAPARIPRLSMSHRQIGTRFGISFLLSAFGCSSSPDEVTKPDTSQVIRKSERTTVLQSVWGRHEKIVNRTRENLTIYVYAIIKNLDIYERDKLLKKIQVVRNLIEDEEIELHKDPDKDLISFMSWLHQINQWSLEEKELLLNR